MVVDVNGQDRQRFFYFLFSFFTKIYFRFGNLQEYTRPPRCQIWPPGSGAARAFLEKKIAEKIARRSLGPVARQRGGRPAAGRPAVIFAI